MSLDILDFVVPIFALSSFLAFLGLRFYIRKTKWCTSKRRLEGKTAIITGGSGGIGRAIATDLAQRGCRVTLACRSPLKAAHVANEIKKATNNQNVFIMKLDLSDMNSVRYFVREFNSLEDRLDILVNNAGYLGLRFETVDGFDRTFSVNYLGHFLLTTLLLDRLKSCSPSRIINVASDSFKNSSLDLDDLNYTKHPEKYSIYEAYSRSKLALMLFTRELSKRLEGIRVTPIAVHTGPTRTDLLRNWPGLYGFILRTARTLLFRSPAEGAQSAIFCAVADGIEHCSGSLVFNCEEQTIPEHAKDSEIAAKLWDISEELTKLKE